MRISLRNFIDAGRSPRARLFGRLLSLNVICVGLYLLYDAVTFADRALKADGEVLSVSVRRGTDSNTYKPLIRFTTETGVRHDSPTRLWSNQYHYETGARVAIRYDPADPAQVRIDNFWSLYIQPLMFIGIPALILAWDVFNTRRRRRAGRKVAPPEPPTPAPNPDPAARDQDKSRNPTVRR